MSSLCGPDRFFSLFVVASCTHFKLLFQLSSRTLATMADAGGDEVNVKPAAPAPAVMGVQEALKAVLRSAHFADGLAKGLHEAAKALDK